MQSHRARLHKITLTALFLLLLGGSVGGCPDSSPVAKRSTPPLSLTIITPHNDKIRQAFEVGFSEWHRTNNNRKVIIDWIVRGTPQCVAYVNDLFEGNLGADGARSPDIMFGGGIADHGALASRAQTYQLDLAAVLDGIPESVNNLPTRDAEGNWFATGLSSFGIVYNQKACVQRGLTPPKTWTDLADPEYFGWVAVADPNSSGSHAQAMIMILEHLGWSDGWSVIMRTLGNARTLAPGSSDAANQVATGYCLAGYSVNFTGLAAQENSPDLKYVNPPNATAATPDIISVLKTSTDRELAQRFVEFCLGEEGQTTWGVRPEFRKTVGDTLYHYPIDPEIYAKYEGKLAVTENPYETQFGVKIDLDRAADEATLITPLVQAACGDNHVLLQQAWRAVIDSGMNPQALAELTAPPIQSDQLGAIASAFRDGDEEKREHTRSEWSKSFRERYERTLELTRQ